jgi:cytochrome P450
VHAAAIWTIIEIFSDATLLSRVRAELRAADFQSFTTNAAVDKLISLPLLQSIYSEVLRLRVEVQHVLYSNHDEIQLNEYRFPRRQIIMVPSGPAHLNADAWNTRDGEHPRHLLGGSIPRVSQRSPQRARSQIPLLLASLPTITYLPDD